MYYCKIGLHSFIILNLFQPTATKAEVEKQLESISTVTPLLISYGKLNV